MWRHAQRPLSIHDANCWSRVAPLCSPSYLSGFKEVRGTLCLGSTLIWLRLLLVCSPVAFVRSPWCDMFGREQHCWFALVWHQGQNILRRLEIACGWKCRADEHSDCEVAWHGQEDTGCQMWHGNWMLLLFMYRIFFVLYPFIMGFSWCRLRIVQISQTKQFRIQLLIHDVLTV